MSKKIAIISGITGQDGGYLSQLLLKENYKIVGLTRSNNNFNNSNFKYLGINGQIQIEECDLLIFQVLSKFC